MGTSGLVATLVSGIVRLPKKMCPEGNFDPNENPIMVRRNSILGHTLAPQHILHIGLPTMNAIELFQKPSPQRAAGGGRGRQSAKGRGPTKGREPKGRVEQAESAPKGPRADGWAQQCPRQGRGPRNSLGCQNAPQSKKMARMGQKTGPGELFWDPFA